MEGTEAFQVNISEQFNLDLEEVYQYGLETFGLAQVERYENDIFSSGELNSLLYEIMNLYIKKGISLLV